MKDIVSILKEKQRELFEKYKELEILQSELPYAYNIIQNDMQRIDEINGCYRIAICNIETAERLESEVV